MTQPLGPVNLARVYLLVGGGLPVCTAILVYALSFTAYEFLAKQPFAPRSDLVETWVFGLPAAVVLLICLRAYRRVSAGSDSGPTVLLAKLVPLLILVGVVGGVWFTYKLILDTQNTRQMLERSLCEDVLVYREGSRDWTGPADEKLVTACLPAAHACDQERRKTETKSGWNVHPDRDQRPEIICLRKAGHAAGWLH